MNGYAKKLAALITALAASAALVFLGFGLGNAKDGTGTSAEDNTVALTWIIRNDGSPIGWRVDLNDSRLAFREGDRWYGAYLEGPRGRVSVGTFNVGNGITLWSGVSPAEYPRFVITGEPDGRVIASADLDVPEGAKHLVAPLAR